MSQTVEKTAPEVSRKGTGEPMAAACALPPSRMRPLNEALSFARASAILSTRRRWTNGTTIHFYLFDGTRGGGAAWKGSKAEQRIVRDAFKEWKSVGIGLEFAELAEPEDAEVRISFEKNGRSWSYVARDVLNSPSPDEPTMNFGWSLATDADTALHEIGHTLGLPHEHQNPNAGIVWNEAAVVSEFSGAPNFWDKDLIRRNILSKQDPRDVDGSDWDPKSVMHYSFGRGLVAKPVGYENGIFPPGGLSQGDKAWVARFYPPMQASNYRQLVPHQSEFLRLASGEQANFVIKAEQTRKHTLQLFGEADCVMVLFEILSSEGETPRYRYVAGEDDAGEDRNGTITTRLIKGNRYVLRVLMQYSPAPDQVSLMAH